jgi:hypothetical protein
MPPVVNETRVGQRAHQQCLMDREPLIAFWLVFVVFSRQRTTTLPRAGK